MLLSVVVVIDLFVCSVAKLENLGLKIIQAKLKICDLPLFFFLFNFFLIAHF